jgi:hypothetical protein
MKVSGVPPQADQELKVLSLRIKLPFPGTVKRLNVEY